MKAGTKRSMRAAAVAGWRASACAGLVVLALAGCKREAPPEYMPEPPLSPDEDTPPPPSARNGHLAIVPELAA